MNKLKDIALGVITAIGGFVDAGQLLTNTQAGAMFRFGLLWTVPFCVVAASVYEEMAARLAMSTERALFDAIRERMGFRLGLVPLAAISLVNLLTLIAELAGMSLAMQLATGIDYRVWALPATFVLWLVLWKGPFVLLENGASLLATVIVVYVWAVWRLGVPWREAAAEQVHPPMGEQPVSMYLFSVVALIGAFVSPFQILFYSSGAVEEGWKKDYVWANRIIAWSGNIFGGVVAACVIIVAAIVLHPRGMKIDEITDSRIGVVETLGAKGFWLFVAGLLFCSMAAALQVGLSSAYAVTEFFGWHWKKDEPPAESALFHLVHTLFLGVALAVVLSGIKPGSIAQSAMAFNAVALPFTLFPLLVTAQDPRFARKPLTNGWVSSAAGWVFFVVLAAAAVAGVPLFIITGGGP
jgi:Mn2+/Fe2+ NRAMP family transporter